MRESRSCSARPHLSPSGWMKIPRIRRGWRKSARDRAIRPRSTLISGSRMQDWWTKLPQEQFRRQRVRLGWDCLSYNIVSRMADITDGLSHTVMYTESAGRPYLFRRGKLIGPSRRGLVNGGGWCRPASDMSIDGSSGDGATDVGPCAINCTNGTMWAAHRTSSVLRLDWHERAVFVPCRRRRTSAWAMDR